MKSKLGLCQAFVAAETLGVVTINNPVQGNIEGLRKVQLAQLAELYNLETPPTQIASLELISSMSRLTSEINREIAVHLNRRGQVIEVLIGDGDTVPLSTQKAKRSESGLNGLRCIHTHPSGSSALSSVDLSALILLKLDLIASLGVVNGHAKAICYASLRPEAGELGQAYELSPAYTPEQLVTVDFVQILREVERELKPGWMNTSETEGPEKAILVGLELPEKGKKQLTTNLLAELADLAKTAGAEVVAEVIQKRSRPDPTYYLGFGKLAELRLLAQVKQADVIILDSEISPAQQRNIEKVLGLKVIDRTRLILDIFAQRAQTKEGKLQVELAQLHYILPRLIGTGITLSRLGGGIGTRGPGETKLETDRRRIRSRIKDMEQELEQVRLHRERIRRTRERNQLPIVALVGYTNAGKSTLLNALTNANVLTEDKLFATLDPTTRKVELAAGRSILLTDTVGFIRKLPHHLVSAFRATLEETLAADLLLHVVDASSLDFVDQMITVQKVLSNLRADQIPSIVVFNKIDLVQDDSLINLTAKAYPNAIELSAKTRQGFPELTQLLLEQLPGVMTRCELLLPYGNGNLLALVHNHGKVISEEYLAEGVKVIAELDEQTLQRVKAYLLT